MPLEKVFAVIRREISSVRTILRWNVTNVDFRFEVPLEVKLDRKSRSQRFKTDFKYALRHGSRLANGKNAIPPQRDRQRYDDSQQRLT